MPPKTSKPTPPAALAPEVDETTDSASDYGHIDEFIASLSAEEKMYLMTKLEEESAPENSDDKEYDEAVGLRAPSSVNDEGEMD